MKKFTAKQLRQIWINFFEEKGHKNIGSASLIPENDPSVLFTTAGMHPLVPYLLGEPHPAGKRLCNVQKCIRTGDIESVGDKSHLTFFEMLGNWSLGDYFKAEKVKWTYEFLTSPKYLGLRHDELAITCFAGDKNAPKDTETAELWIKLGFPNNRIYFLPKEDNWWELNRGPCGPDNEFFLDTGKPKCNKDCNPSCGCGKFIELGNDVYMQYNKISDKKYVPANQKNVDTGFGIERNLIILNGVNSVYETEAFESAIKKIEKLSGKNYVDSGDENTISFRIIADHVRAATAILGDKKGITPSNTDAGYVLRRLIRRAILNAQRIGIKENKLGEIAKEFIEFFKDTYPEFKENEEKILSELAKEEERFRKTLVSGEKEFEKTINGILKHEEFAKEKGEKVERKISGKAAFRLYDTYGFPLEITKELAKEKGFEVNEGGFAEAFKAHQELARSGSEQHFKGGLADTSEQTIKLHTAAHLLQAALRKVLGTHVQQKGSNITSERLRFDFSHDKPMTSEEIKKVESIVNDAISKKLPVKWQEMTLEEAKKSGAFGVFESRYGEKVKVYTIDGFSCEICGGPHVKNTGELGEFNITKEQSSSFGIRRIRAELR